MGQQHGRTVESVNYYFMKYGALHSVNSNSRKYRIPECVPVRPKLMAHFNIFMSNILSETRKSYHTNGSKCATNILFTFWVYSTKTHL